MRLDILWTVLRREWYETFRNRLLMSTIIIPPVLLTVAPIVLAGAIGNGGGRTLPPELARQILAQKPEWSSFSPGELAGAFAVQQFLVFFLLMPAYIPLSIATFSIIGEKQARSLEPVLAAPIRTVELLTGKAIAALVPGVLAGWATYVTFVLLASFVYGPALFGVVTDASWLAGVFLLGPAVGLSSVVAGVIVSSRVNDPRVAQQIGGVVIVPIIALVLAQATGTILVGPTGYVLLTIVVLAIALVGLRVGVRLFDREAILTRWR
jgi:ABC-2 type transport system permease protein